MDKIEKKSKKGLALKIIIPVIIVFILAGIWIFKNVNDGSEVSNQNNPDFALFVTEKLDMEKLKSYGLPIIIDFGADSCIPCKLMAPVLKDLNLELMGKAIIRFVDVWKYQSFAEGYPVSSIPTQIFFDSKGKPYNPKNPKALSMEKFSSKITGAHTYTAHVGGLTKEQMLTVLKEMGMK